MFFSSNLFFIVKQKDSNSLRSHKSFLYHLLDLLKNFKISYQLERNASTAHNESFNTITVNLCDDSSSCYYLHLSDNPDALLVSEIFTGKNYIVWSRSMTIALTVKSKISFIDGSLMQPNTNNQSLRVAWLRSNNLVLSWRWTLLPKTFATTFDIWEELRVRYLRSDGPRVFSLEKSLSSISQNSKTVTDYFSQYQTTNVEILIHVLGTF